MALRRVLPGQFSASDDGVLRPVGKNRAFDTSTSGGLLVPSDREEVPAQKSQLLGIQDCIPCVQTLDEALASCLPADVIITIRRSVASIPRIYQENKAQFDILAKTLIANSDTLSDLPAYCRVAGSFRKRGIIKVLQRLIVDGYITSVCVPKEQIESWPLYQENAYLALPDTLSQLLRPGILSMTSSHALLQVEEDQLVENAVTVTCYQLKKHENKPKKKKGTVQSRKASASQRLQQSTGTPVKTLDEIGRQYLTQSDEGDDTIVALPMDLCPFDDSNAQDAEADTLEPPLKTVVCSNVEWFFKSMRESAAREGKIEHVSVGGSSAAREASSVTEVSTPLLSISSTVSENTRNSITIPAFRKAPYFQKYQSIKLYRDFVAELYASLQKENKHLQKSSLDVPLKIVSKLISPYNFRDTIQASLGKKLREGTLPDVRAALEKCLTDGKKGNAFYNIQPDIKVGDHVYLNKCGLLHMINTQKGTQLLTNMIQKHYKGKSLLDYMRHISATLEHNFEQVQVMEIEAVKNMPKRPTESEWLGFCCLLVQKVNGTNREPITVPYLPVGVGNVGSFILKEQPLPHEESTAGIFPGSMVRIPMARYSAEARGMQLVLTQAVVINVKQYTLVLVEMEIRDAITDELSKKNHNVLNTPKSNEILCYSANVFTRSIWDVLLCPDANGSVMLPHRLCGKSILDVRTNKKVLMSDYAYAKRLKRTSLFRTLDCTDVSELGHKFRLLQIESARDLLRAAKIPNADEEIICENSLYILSALMIHPACICLLEADCQRDVQTIYDIGHINAVYFSLKKLEFEVKAIFSRYETEQCDDCPGTARQLAYNALKIYFYDLLLLYSP